MIPLSTPVTQFRKPRHMSAGYNPVAPDGHAKQVGLVAGSYVGLLVGTNVGGLDVGFDDVRGGCIHMDARGRGSYWQAQ